MNVNNKFFDHAFGVGRFAAVKNTRKNVFIFLKLSVLFLENEASAVLDCQVVALKTQCISKTCVS